MNLLIYIVYYVYINLYIHIYMYIPNQALIRVSKLCFLLLNVIECKTLRSIYSISLVFHNACFE